jgi:hypothetical protein
LAVLFTYIQFAHFFDINIFDKIAQGTIFLFPGQIVVTHAVHAAGFRPVLEDVFTKRRVTDFFNRHLVTPGRGIAGLVHALIMDGVGFGEGLKGKKNKTEQCEH